ncbi:hypothetical protein Pelo_4353 [Pelomyxa schiedti]|nr:hypothetical protein Pelo_4353 [Pelomyxa schiedti]
MSISKMLRIPNMCVEIMWSVFNDVSSNLAMEGKGLIDLGQTNLGKISVTTGAPVTASVMVCVVLGTVGSSGLREQVISKPQPEMTVSPSSGDA